MKKLLVIHNKRGVAAVKHLSTFAEGQELKTAVLAACAHLFITPPEADELESILSGQDSTIIGSGDDLYCIVLMNAANYPKTRKEWTAVLLRVAKIVLTVLNALKK